MPAGLPDAAARKISSAAASDHSALPLGKSAAGLPIGAQLAGAYGADGMLLDLALAIEEAAPWDALAPRSRWAT